MTSTRSIRDQIDAARRTHPALMHEGVSRRSDAYLPLHRAPSALHRRAARSAARPRRAVVHVSRPGRRAQPRLDPCRRAPGWLEEAREDLVLAVNELVTNSVQYGGGGGTLRIWTEPDALVCDVRDRGYIDDPLAGRIAPPLEQHGGRGLWLVNHLCDLVQIRSTPKRHRRPRARAPGDRRPSASSRRRPAAAAPCSCSSARRRRCSRASRVELLARAPARPGFARAQAAAPPR